MRGPLVATVLAVTVVLVAVAPRASAAIEKPAYAKGDFWTYRSTLDVFGLRLAGNSTLTAGDVVSVPIEGTPVGALELGLSGGGTFSGSFSSIVVTGNWTVTGSEHWETGAWTSVRSFLRLVAIGTVTGPPPLPFTLTVVNETTRHVTADTFPWPIPEGATGATTAHWLARQNVTVEFQGQPPQWNETTVDANLTTTHEQVGRTSIAVPAGTFDAFRIEERGPGPGHRERWWAPRAGNDARQTEFNETGEPVTVSDLAAFRYQAGEPAPPFPWLPVLFVGLAVVVVILFVALARRRRKAEPVEVWLPPEPGGPSP